MVKVGILSMQRIANYGSFLQAYGLKKILEELGCSVEFVDYHPGKCLIPTRGGTGVRRKLYKVTDILTLNAPLKEKLRFIRYKKNYHKKYFPYLGISKHMNYTPILDLLVIGSDEVFNCVQSNPNVGLSPELFGEGNRSKRLITYAASFGNTDIRKIDSYNLRDRVTEWLKKIDAISVRDANSGDIIERLTKGTPRYNIDPVLAYRFLSQCEEIPKSLRETKYMILYGYSGRFSIEECKVISDYANTIGVKVFCISGVQHCCDKFIDCNPFQVIAYFQNAECVVTDTFHGAILSIITHQRFVTFIRNNGYGNSEKLEDLLHRLCLTDRIIKEIGKLQIITEKRINYEYVDSIIEQERENTYDYLRKEIGLCIQN